MYSSFRPDGGYNLFITNRDGSQTRQLTDSPSWDRSPRWSPDGRSILFTRWLTQNIEQNRNFWIGESWDERIAIIYSDNFEVLTLPSRIAVIGSNGSGLREVTSMVYNSWAPCWSPDGRWLAFASDRDGDSEIYIMPADMREERTMAVTRNTFIDSMPSWGR